MERPVDKLAFAVGILLSVVVLLVCYILFIQLQLRHVNRQLKKRLSEHTRQPISVGLLSKELDQLAINITECLKAEENLRLEGVREEKRFREMIADISHDLRTPLTAIKGYQQLMEKGPLTEDQRKKLRIAQKHADELGGLIEHFFEYSRLLSADTKPNPERFNLTNLVAECLADSVTVLEENRLAVRFDQQKPIFVYADKEYVTRIMQNLIRNCVQHSAGDIGVSLTTGEKAVLSFKNAVKDADGIQAERLFDRFYTADRARGGGTGLGLSIVKLLAEQTGGAADASLRDGILEIDVELPLTFQQL